MRQKIDETQSMTCNEYVDRDANFRQTVGRLDESAGACKKNSSYQNLLNKSFTLAVLKERMNPIESSLLYFETSKTRILVLVSAVLAGWVFLELL